MCLGFVCGLREAPWPLLRRRLRELDVHIASVADRAFWKKSYVLIEYVPAGVVRLKKAIWFCELDSEQVASVEKFLAGSGYSRLINPLRII